MRQIRSQETMIQALCLMHDTGMSAHELAVKLSELDFERDTREHEPVIDALRSLAAGAVA